MAKRLITVEDVVKAAQSGSRTIPAPARECIITPAAREKAAALALAFTDQCQLAEEESATCCPASTAPGESAPAGDQAGAAGLAEEVSRQVYSLVKDRLGGDMSPQELEGLVREVVGSKLASPGACPRSQSGRGTLTQTDSVCIINGSRLLEGESSPVPVPDKMILADAIPCDDEKYMLAGGYMEWEKASFRRTVEHPEVGVVLEGELHLTVGGRTMITRAGDMIYFAKGANLIYSAPGKVRLACVNCIL